MVEPDVLDADAGRDEVVWRRTEVMEKKVLVTRDRKADLEKVADADDASALAGARKARAVPRPCNPLGSIADRR